MQCLEVRGDDLARVLEQFGRDLLKHALDDAAAVLMEAEADEVLLEDLDDEFNLLKA